jgi:hypothetical protein
MIKKGSFDKKTSFFFLIIEKNTIFVVNNGI